MLMFMNIKQQSEIFMDRLAKRRKNPAKPSTLNVYRSLLSNHILPTLGEMPVSKVENGVMRTLVERMVQAGLSPSTIAGVTNCVKEIVGSAIDANGNQLHPRTWNSDFIDSPPITGQKAPIITQLEANRAISATSGQYRALFALLAGSGLRISEALALKAGPNPQSSYFDRKRGVLVVSSQLYNGQEITPKTSAGVREIDLSPELVVFLSRQFPESDKLMFPVSYDTVLRMAGTVGVPGLHSFRRFRKTHLEKNNVPEGLMRFWMGHADRDVADRYVKYGREIESRKEWAQKAGLGFELP